MTGPTHSTGSTGGSNRDRGVSDLIAFVLMFAIIITGVGVVSFGAFDNLSEFSDREKVESGERGLAAAAATIDDIHRQGDTQRSFALALGGGDVYLNESEVSLTLNPSSSSAFPQTHQINATEQRFDRSPEDVTVFYEGGAVFRSPGFGARYEPSLQCEVGDTAIVSLVKLEARNFAISKGYDSSVILNPRGLPGESPVADLDDTLLFSAEFAAQNRTYRTFDSTDPNLVVDFTESSDPEQWDNYFEQSDGWDVPTSAPVGVGQCSNLDAVLIRVTTVELSV